MKLRNYGKKSKRMIRLAVFIKGLTASLGTSAFVMDNKNLAFGILLIGAISNEIINFINDESTDNSNISNNN